MHYAVSVPSHFRLPVNNKTLITSKLKTRANGRLFRQLLKHGKTKHFRERLQLGDTSASFHNSFGLLANIFLFARMDFKVGGAAVHGGSKNNRAHRESSVKFCARVNINTPWKKGWAPISARAPRRFAGICGPSVSKGWGSSVLSLCAR